MPALIAFLCIYAGVSLTMIALGLAYAQGVRDGQERERDRDTPSNQPQKEHDAP